MNFHLYLLHGYSIYSRSLSRNMLICIKLDKRFICSMITDLETKAAVNLCRSRSLLHKMSRPVFVIEQGNGHCQTIVGFQKNCTQFGVRARLDHFRERHQE